MHLVEHYINRRGLNCVSAPFISQRSSVYLRQKDDKELGLYQLIVEKKREENTHAKLPFFHVSLYSSPTILSNKAKTQVSMKSSKMIEDFGNVQWEDYDAKLESISKSLSAKYRAIDVAECKMICWEYFLQNFDSWIAPLVPARMIGGLISSLDESKDFNERSESINFVEKWLQSKAQHAFMSWVEIKNTIDPRAYAGWLVQLINN